MNRASLAPSPRQYPPSVHLHRRAHRGRAVAPAPQSAEQIETWLLDEAVRVESLLDLYEMFVWRLVVAGLPLDRASLHTGTLHPQLIGIAWNWNIADGIVDEVKVAQNNLDTDSFKRSPLAMVFETGLNLLF